MSIKCIWAVEQGRVACIFYYSLFVVCLNWLKCVVVSPHNTLLTMHRMQATKYFLGTSLRVKKLLPSDVAVGEISSNFDLLFISIHAFKDLIDNNDDQLCQWNIKSQEYLYWCGVLYDKLFCHTHSWASLCKLARHEIKINHFILSATAHRAIVRHYLGLGNYKVIGELDKYPIPDVVINVERYSDGEVLSVIILTRKDHRSR